MYAVQATLVHPERDFIVLKLLISPISVLMTDEAISGIASLRPN